MGSKFEWIGFYCEQSQSEGKQKNVRGQRVIGGLEKSPKLLDSFKSLWEEEEKKNLSQENLTLGLKMLF